MASAPAAFLVVATVRRPHGIRGEIHIGLDTDRPNSVFRKGRTVQLGDPNGRPLGHTHQIEQARPVPGGMILKMTGCTSRTEAEALRAHTLLIPVEEAAPAGQDEVPYHALLGLQVTVQGAPIGTVKEILDTPGVELLVVERAGTRELLVPFVKEMVRRVDLDGRQLEIDPPEGLLDL